MFELKSKHRIYASHILKDQGGRCSRLHGHQYEIILELVSFDDVLDEKNMIMDTYEIEEIFNNFIGVDHLHLNEFMGSENPTMEEMSKFFYEGLKGKLPKLYSVTVYETPESCVTYNPFVELRCACSSEEKSD